MQTLLSMIEPTGKENGCLSYQVFENIENQNVFCLLEEWNTRKNLDLYLKSKMFGILLGIGPLLREPLSIQIHTISHSDGMERVHALRAKAL